MNARSPRGIFTASLLLALAVAGCSKDKGTNPPPSGGAELSSGTIAAGSGQYVHTFAAEGHFPYHCTIHTSMQGSIHVAIGGLDSLIVNIGNSDVGFQPQAVGGVTIVKPGGYVHWKSVSSQPHTVTSD